MSILYFSLLSRSSTHVNESLQKQYQGTVTPLVEYMCKIGAENVSLPPLASDGSITELLVY